MEIREVIIAIDKPKCPKTVRKDDGERFSFSPLIMQAMGLYEFTYGLIPPLILDIQARKNVIQFKLQKFNIITASWVILVAVAGFLLGVSCALFLAKKLFLPNTTRVDTLGIVALITITTAIMFLGTLALNVLLNYEKVQYLNQLLANKLEFCKK